MSEFINELFSSAFFMPHGHCYLWRPGLVWLQVLSNGFIALAYITISVALAYLVSRVQDLPFRIMYLAFGLFIVSCGITHIFDIWVIWQPLYWIDGLVRAVTAVVSVSTALALLLLLPKAVLLARGAQAAYQHGVHLETVVKDLATMYERTRELEQLKTQLFANVSHELRTPLALILGPVEKLRNAANLDAEQRRDLAVVERNARTLLRHVNDLLEVSRLEGGKVHPNYAAVDLAHLFQVTAGHFDALAGERQIAYIVEAPAEFPAQLDPEMVQRVLLNLLSNAFKFTPTGGRIHCALARWVTEEGHAEVRITVADSGPGVAPDERQVIFERFRQLDRGSDRRFGGTGLGLAIAKDFVTLHRGSIEVDDAPEQGARFTVRLPLAAPAGVAVRAVPQEDRGSEETARAALDELRRRTVAIAPEFNDERPVVLVVEDNPEMLRFIAEGLTEEYRTVLAENGSEALQKAIDAPPDIILTDVMMPGMSGDRLVREVRSRSVFDTVPIVMLTAKADDELRIELLRGGAQDYIMKPFSLAELRARIGNLVSMKRARDILQRELTSQVRDLEHLAGEVTQRKRQVETALDSMRVLREHAEKASQLKSNFLGLVSHELRSPLTGLVLQIERLARDREATLTERQRQLLGRMSISTTRLTELIESLLEYARIQGGRLKVEIQTVDLGQLASTAVEEIRPQAEDKGLTLEMAPRDGLPAAQTDPRLLRLILINLLGNAIKFTDRGGISVSVGRDTRGFWLAVKDSGCGIPPEQQVRVFEPFEQLEPVSSKHTPGVGLGLALVRDMANALGGLLQLESEVGAGSRFTLRLPETSSSMGGGDADGLDRRG